MKKIIIAFCLLLSTPAFARDGSWFGVSSGYESIDSGINEGGLGIAAEGGYWYLGNIAVGGYFKSNFFGEVAGITNSSLRIYDMGAFWKAGNDAGLYGKLLMGVAFVNVNGAVPGFKVGDGKSFYFGLGGGFLFPVTDVIELGPEVLYRHLTAGNDGDQISIGLLLSHSF